MKLCPACRRTFSEKEWKCPRCGHQPVRTGNILSFAPESSAFNEHFPPDSFQRLAPLEEGHFWFRARNELIVWALRKWFSPKGKMMEIGCGTGYVLSRLERDFPGLELSGGEIYSGGLEFASKRLTRSEIIQMDTLSIPYKEEFDIMGLFDTLEHIEQDEAVLAQVHQALVPGGGLVLTVPQHAFLWSYMDTFSGHARRYGRRELVEKLKKAGFRLEMATSFVSFLMPLLWLSRLRQGLQKPDFNPEAELKLAPSLNWFLEKISGFERLMIRAGLRFPFGGSLLVVARKV